MKSRAGTIMIGTGSIMLTVGFFIFSFLSIQYERSDVSKEVFVGFSVVIFTTLIASILMIAGAAMGHQWFLVPWLIMAPMFTIGSLAYLIYGFKLVSEDTRTPETIVIVLFVLGGAVFFVYDFMVVYGYFMEIRKKKSEEAAARLQSHQNQK